MELFLRDVIFTESNGHVLYDATADNGEPDSIGMAKIAGNSMPAKEQTVPPNADNDLWPAGFSEFLKFLADGMHCRFSGLPLAFLSRVVVTAFAARA